MSKIANLMIPSLSFHVSKLQSQEIIPEELMRYSLRSIRYLLFLLTSSFYLAGPPEAPLVIKAIVIITMLAATLLAQNLYNDWVLQIISLNKHGVAEVNDVNQNLKICSLVRLIVMESIGIALLLLPTGGLDSPFAWYALNPIIAAAVFLPRFVCWGVLALFLTTAVASSAIYPGIDGSFLAFGLSHLSQLLIFFLSTSSVQVAAALYKQLAVAYTRLDQAHSAAESSLQHISSLYQALEILSNREDHMQLAEVLAAYAARLCQRPAACLLRNNIEDASQLDRPTLLQIAAYQEHVGIEWEKEMNEIWTSTTPRMEESIHFISPTLGCLITLPIISHGEYCGLLAYHQPP